jgi:hypothetical protein
MAGAGARRRPPGRPPSPSARRRRRRRPPRRRPGRPGRRPRHRRDPTRAGRRSSRSRVDEGRLDARKHRLDPPEVDVADHAAALRAVDEQLDELAVLQDRYPRLAWRRVDEDVSLHQGRTDPGRAATWRASGRSARKCGGGGPPTLEPAPAAGCAIVDARAGRRGAPGGALTDGEPRERAIGGHGGPCAGAERSPGRGDRQTVGSGGRCVPPGPEAPRARRHRGRSGGRAHAGSAAGARTAALGHLGMLPGRVGAARGPRRRTRRAPRRARRGQSAAQPRCW